MSCSYSINTVNFLCLRSRIYAFVFSSHTRYLSLLGNHILPSIFFFSQLLIAITYLFDRYDMWSVGVVILEMILGSPNVFQISDLTRALLDHHLEGWNDSLKELAYR